MGGACPLMSVIFGNLDFFKWGEDMLTISRKVVEGLVWLYEGLSLSEYPQPIPYPPETHLAQLPEVEAEPGRSLDYREVEIRL
jgi:hypothetical protein